MAKRHLEMALNWKGEVLGVLETRRHYGNYFKGVPNFRETKSRILNEKDPTKIFQELAQVINNFAQKELVQSSFNPIVDQIDVNKPSTIIVVKTIKMFDRVKEIG